MNIILIIFLLNTFFVTKCKVYLDPQLNLEQIQRNLQLKKSSQKGLLKKEKIEDNKLRIRVDGVWQDKNQNPNINNKRKLEDFDSFKTSQQIQQINYSNQDIDQIVRDAVKASGHESPVIVINHQSELTLPEDKDNNSQQSQSTDLTQNMNAVSITDIPNLEMILDKISSIYQYFYQSLPQQQSQLSDTQQDKQLQNFMLNLQKFTQEVIVNSEDLMNNINYFERKIHLIQQGEEHMMVFYNYSKRYAKLKAQTSIKSTDTIQQKWHEIFVLSTHYDQQVSQALKNSYALYKFNYQFAQHIKQIDESANQQYTEALQKFDQVLKLSVTLLEQKQQIENAVTQIKKSLQQIKIISYHVDSNMMQIQSILDGVTYDIGNLPEVDNYQIQQDVQVTKEDDKNDENGNNDENDTTKEGQIAKRKSSSSSKSTKVKTGTSTTYYSGSFGSETFLILLTILIFQLFQYIFIMSVVKKYLKEAMVFIKKKDFKSALSKLEILLMKDCLLLNLKCMIELNELEKANKILETLEENYQNDQNVFLARINLLKLQDCPQQDLAIQYKKILQNFLENNDDKKFLSIFQQYLEIYKSEEYFNQQQDEIIEFLQKTLVQFENQDILSEVNDFLFYQFKQGNIDDVDYLEILQKHKNKLSAGESLISQLQLKQLENQENSLAFKLILFNEKNIDEGKLLYKIKHGVFELQELYDWAQNYQNLPEQSEISLNIAFAIKFLEDIFQQNLPNCEINFNINFDLNTQLMGQQSFLNFILKIKEFLELQEDFLPMITFFRSHLNIVSYSWIKEMIFFKLSLYTDFLEEKQYYMQSIFSEFIDKNQEEYENLYYIIWGKYYNKFIKQNYIKFNALEYLKTEFNINLVKNPQILDEKELYQFELLYKTQNNLDFKYFLIKQYIQYLQNLKKISQQNFKLEDFQETKDNIFMYRYIVKLTFYFSKNIERDLQQIQNIKNLHYVLRDEQNFQIFYKYVVSNLDFNDKINMLGFYFDYLQEYNWFLVIFGSLLVENQDFQNSFILFRRLYENLKYQIQNKVYVPDNDQNDLYVDYDSEIMSKIFISRQQINSLSDIYNQEYIFNNKVFHRQLLENVFLVNSINYKHHFSLQVIQEIKDQDIDIYQEDPSYSDLNKIFKQMYVQFCSSDLQDEENNIKRGLLIEQTYIYAQLGDVANFRKTLKILISYNSENLINLKLLKSIYSILDYYQHKFKDVLTRVQNTIKKSCEEFINYIKNSQYQQQLIPYIIIYTQIISLFDLDQCQQQLIETFINLKLEKHQDRLNQLLVGLEEQNNKLNLDDIQNLLSLCIRDINNTEKLDEQKLFYLFNLEKENILIWLIMAKFFYNKEKYLLSYECLLKADYLMDNSQPDIYRNYFDLQVINIKKVIDEDNKLKVNQVLQSAYVSRDENCDSSLIKEEKLKNSLVVYWQTQNFDKFLPLAEFYCLLLLNQNRIKELCDILIQIPEFIFEMSKNINFAQIHSLKTPSYTKNPLKILQKIICYMIHNKNLEQQQINELQDILNHSEKSNNWRTFLLNYAKTTCLNVTLKNDQQKNLIQLLPLNKSTQSENKKDKINKIKSIKYQILRDSYKLKHLKKLLEKQVTQPTKNLKENSTILKQDLNQLYQLLKNKYNLEEFFSGIQVWEQTDNLEEASKISLYNSIELLQNIDLTDSQKQALCQCIKQDIEMNRYLVLPLLKYYYNNNKDDELEELLLEISEKKVDQKLEHLINFYVLLFKIKMKETQDDEEEEENEVQELLDYFEAEKINLNLKNSIRFLGSIYEILLKGEKNFQKIFKTTKYCVLTQPNLYFNAQKFVLNKYKDNLFTLQLNLYKQ